MNTVFDDIKAKLDIVTLVSGYTKLKRAGRNFKGLCPFHSEKTPSFMVSPDKQIAYCFGCQKGGDVFRFIQETEHLDPSETLKYLADKAHVDLSSYGTTLLSGEEKARVKSQTDEAYKICEESMKIYEHNLWSTEEGAKVLTYLRGRGMRDETIRAFHIGFAKDSFDHLYSSLLAKGFSKDDMLATGQVIAKSTDASQVFDRFRLRLMMPIFDARGKVVGFGGRQLRKDDDPKYLNSPETSIYHKSKVLYGFNVAKESIRDKGNVLLMEGYFDVISAHQAGFANAVATSGTALTIEQIRLLKRFTKEMYLVFDSDKAGKLAADRATEMLVKEGCAVHIVKVIGHKDPDEACKAGDFDRSLAGALYYLDYYLEEAKAMLGDGGAQVHTRDKIKIAEYFFYFLSFAQEEIEVSHYLKTLATLLQVKDEDLTSKFTRFKRQNTSKDSSGQSKEELPEFTLSLVDYFFGFLMTFPTVIPYCESWMSSFPLESAINDVYKRMKAHYNGDALECHAFLAGLSEEQRSVFTLASLWVEKEFGEGLRSIDQEKEVKTLLERLIAGDRKRQSTELTFKIREAEKSGNSAFGEEYLHKKASIYHNPNG